tara:strand:+ start:997 stop:1260 length:264 start_codon:yes stop_codon:yes gene_type:complete
LKTKNKTMAIARHYVAGQRHYRKVIMDHIKIHQQQNDVNEKMYNYISSIRKSLMETDRVVERHRKGMIFMLIIQAVFLLILMYEVTK